MQLQKAIRSIGFLFLLIFSITSSADTLVTNVKDVCDVKNTDLHYAQSNCFQITATINDESSETFKLKGTLITKDINNYKNKKTLILLPGGPGNPSKYLRYELQKRDFINSFWSGMDINVVIFDPRGTGSSSFKNNLNTYPKSSFSTTQQVMDLKKIIDKINVENEIYFLAHSAGGILAFEFIKQHHEIVSGSFMHSTIISATQGFKLNKDLNSLNFPFWTNILDELNTIGYKSSDKLNNKYLEIENSLINQFKARILNSEEFIYPDFPTSMSPQSFRENIYIEYNKDTITLKPLINFINIMYDYLIKITSLPKSELYPLDLQKMMVSVSSMPRATKYDNDIIRQAVFCSEGASKKDLNAKYIYPGITMNYFCEGIHNKQIVLSEKSLLKLYKTQFYFYGGSSDTKVPAHIQKENALSLNNSPIQLIKGEGHIAFHKSPISFYNALNEFINK